MYIYRVIMKVKTHFFNLKRFDVSLLRLRFSVHIYIYIFSFLCILNFLCIFYIFYRDNHLGSKAFIFCVKMFMLSVYFNSADRSFRSIAANVSNPDLLVFMFCLFTVTPELTL